MLTLFLVACTGPDKITIYGDTLADELPTDGQRRYEYLNTDPGAAFTLVVEKVDAVEVDGVEHVTYAWTREDTDAPLGSVTWSSSESDGIAIHAWTDAAGVEEVFTPPVVVAQGRSRVGDVVTTTTGGRDFTSTYVGREDCPVPYGVDLEDCARVSVDDGDGDEMAGPLFAGEYWLVPTYGIAWMHTTGYAATWELSDFEWQQ